MESVVLVDDAEAGAGAVEGLADCPGDAAVVGDAEDEGVFAGEVYGMQGLLLLAGGAGGCQYTIWEGGYLKWGRTSSRKVWNWWRGLKEAKRTMTVVAPASA